MEGGPGHGEGHNSGQAVNIAAALAVKELMQQRGPARHADAVAGHRRGTAGRQGVPGARRLFDGVDAVLFTHVGDNLGDRLGRGARRRRADLGGIHVPRRIRARRRCTLARTQRARCGRADEHGLERAPRTSAAGAALALHHHLWRRTAERRARRWRKVWYCYPRDRRTSIVREELRDLQSHRRRRGA